MPRRVLIADDNDTVRYLLRSRLESKGNVEICAETADGQATLTFALAMQPDLLVLDVVMPEVNGLEIAAILKESLPKTKTVLFTMYGDAIKSLALVAGVHAIVPKPEGISELMEAVGKRPDGANLTRRVHNFPVLVRLRFCCGWTVSPTNLRRSSSCIATDGWHVPCRRLH